MSSTKVTVRAATPSDVGAILGLIHELAEYEREPASTVEATEESLLNTLRFTPPHPTSQNLASCLLAFVPSSPEPVGLALYFTNYSTWRGRGGIYLEDLFVKESARGQRIGKRLLGELAREVGLMNGGRLEWSVLKWNEPSIQFYKSLGAVVMDEWHTMRVDGDALTKLGKDGEGIEGTSTTLIFSVPGLMSTIKGLIAEVVERGNLRQMQRNALNLINLQNLKLCIHTTRHTADMDSAVESAPEPPQGYVHAGHVSEYRPSVLQEDGTQAPPTETTANECSDNEKELNAFTSEAESPLFKCSITAVAASTENPAVECPRNDAHQIKVVEISQPAGRYPPKKRVAVTYFHGKWYAFLNICPHQGSALSRGVMTDIEDMGIVWGAGVTCSLHGWTFDAVSGQSDSTRFVVDTFDVKEIDGHIFVSEKPRNSHVAGPRRDFGGRELN
ncbi:hypothetical protein BGZ68_000318 [Mortierella alpina]|nr:hypothetical protein BGZ68_000318 [Mortierella alpina]